jgi:hypothetical protein
VIGKPQLADAHGSSARARLSEAAPLAMRAYDAAPAAGPRQLPSTAERSTWERVALSPDIELHVRRPLDRQANKQLDQLLAAARAIFKRE